MKKIWSFIKPIVYSYTLQYLFIFIGLLIYVFIKRDMNIFSSWDVMYKYIVIGIVITSIPICIYIFKRYKIKESKIHLSKMLLMIPLGLSMSLFYNMLTINFQVNVSTELNIYLLILYLVIVAPIFEEFVFRYLSLRMACDAYSKTKAIIYVSLAFALMHSGLINMIYAFLIGVLLSYVYLKYKNILYPIILHIAANLMSVCINKFNMVYLLISFIVLLLIIIYLRDKETN